jgi:5-carboxymethyl-2-hydroxymuconate isomerase
MAHVVVEYTDNLTPQGDIPALLAMIAKELRNANGVFPVGGIRVRAIRFEDYVVADGAEDDAFVHITVKMAKGRPEEVKKAIFTALFEKVKEHFAALYAKRYLALSMYVEEADETGSFKHNNIHLRFKKGGS